MLLTYGSDCTPIVTRRQFRASFQDLQVRRSGKTCGEWLIQRAFVLSGDNERLVVLAEPKLLQDKSAWTHVAAFRQLLPLPREIGHKGLCVCHHIYDRAICTAMERHHKELHCARKLFDESNMRPGDARLSALLTWCLTVPCVNHDAHNSLKWAIAPWCDSKVCMRNLFITIEALRQSYSELVSHAPAWLSRSVVFEDCKDIDTLRRLWTFCALAPTWVDTLVELQLRYEGGAMKICTRWKDHPDLPELLMTILLKVWEWRRFSDSRWASLGASCRSILAACLCGLPDFVGEVLNDPNAHTYYLKGFLYLTDEVKALVGLIAASSFVADSLLAELMEDDRVPKRYTELQAELLMEVEYVESMSMPLFTMIADACGVNAFTLRHQVMSSVLTQAGFFSERIRAAAELPWSLAHGPPGEALDRLVAGARPTDETAAKIFDLCNLGYNRPALEKGLWLLSMASWSSAPVEQGHVHASMLMKKHADYGEGTLSARAMLISMNALVRQDPQATKLLQLQRRLDSLDKRMPEKINGRHIYFKELSAVVREKRQGGQSVPDDFNKKLMNSHGGLWKRQKTNLKGKCRTMAETVRDDERENINDKRQEVHAEMQILMGRRAADEADANRPLRVSSCRWSIAHLAELDRLFKSPEWSSQRVEKLREEAAVPVQPFPRTSQAILESMDIGRDHCRNTWYEWVPFLCKHRSVFTSCIVRFDSPGGPLLFKVCFARQSPMVVCFMRVRETVPDRELMCPSNHQERSFIEWRHVFKRDGLCFEYSDSGFFQQDWDMHVLADTYCWDGGTFVSDGDWLMIEEFVCMLPDAEEGHHPKRNGPKPSKEQVDFAACPWLMDLLGPGASPPPAEKKVITPTPTPRNQDIDAGGSSNLEHHDLDIDCAQVMDELMARRLELAAANPHTAEHFRWTLRGGAWTARNRGLTYDSCMSSVRKGGEAEQFCNEWGLVRSASFAISIYGEQGAAILARSWVAFHEWSFQTYMMHAGEAGWSFTPEVLAEYQEPPELEGLMASGNARVRNRIAALRQIKPRRQ